MSIDPECQPVHLARLECRDGVRLYKPMAEEVKAVAMGLLGEGFGQGVELTSVIPMLCNGKVSSGHISKIQQSNR